jgi:hypothetical protein
MDIIGNVKEIADLAKKYDDIEFYRKIVELEGEVIELTRQLRQAECKGEELEEKLTLKTRMKFEQPFYYQDGDSVPFCPRCYEAEIKAVHVVLIGQGERTRWDCPACNKMFLIEGAHRARHQVSPHRVGPWS